MSLSREQLATRRGGISATEAACIVGLNPYRKPIDVYLDKMGEAPPFTGNERSRWGEILEIPIREDYERRHNVRVDVPGTLRSELYAWALATPDGVVYPIGAREPTRGLEVKVHGRDAVWYGQLEYGAPGTDEVPAHELGQCQWNMLCSGLPTWDLVAFLDGAPVDYTIERDDDLIGMMVEACDRFRVDHMIARVPPEPDGSSSYHGWQKRKWKGKELDPTVLVLDADHPLRDTIMQLREARVMISELEQRRNKHAQTIKEVLGDKTGIEWMDERGKKSKITWKRNRSGTTTDYELAFKAAQYRAGLSLAAHQKTLNHAMALAKKFESDEVVHEVAVALDDIKSALTAIAGDELVVDNTTEIDGARPFLVPRHWSKNESDKPKHATTKDD